MAAAESSQQAPSPAAVPAALADVRLEGVTKHFGDVVAVDNISISIEP